MKKTYIYIILLIILVLFIGMSTKLIKSNNKISQETYANNKENMEEINFLDVRQIIESTELQRLKGQIKMSLNNSRILDINILPTKLNGVKCNTIAYNNFFDEYNHTYDAIIPNVTKGEIQLSSAILNKVKSIKIDNAKEINNINYIQTNSAYLFEIQETGRYIIDCEFENNTEASIVFEIIIY